MEKNTDEILRDATSIWHFLAKNAGLDTIFYDRDILDGNEAMMGLYEKLGIQKKHPADFGKDLEEQSVSTKAFLKAFFDCLQPYAQMMENICHFFERHEIIHTNKAMRIEFDFGGSEESDFSFNLDNFKEILESYKRVQVLYESYALKPNDLWGLRSIFSEYLPKETLNRTLIIYREDYQRGQMRPKEAIIFPDDLSDELRIQLLRVWSVWESFVSEAEVRNINRTNFTHYLEGRNNIDQFETSEWNSSDIAVVISDFWPVALLESIFYRLDLLNVLNSSERQQESTTLALVIKTFLDQRILLIDEMQLIEEMEELLNLPIWQRRHELYAAWILSEIDKTFHVYPQYRLHHQSGVLTLPFKATLLASFQCDKGNMELWSEAKTQLHNPEGKGRKANIQPDYTIFCGSGRQPERGTVVVEVKQYRKPNNRNFSSALNDYATGLPNAYVFLVNYMAVPSNMVLKYAERSCPLGQISPGQPETADFAVRLKDQLPVTLAKELQGISTILMQAKEWPLDIIYVDISASLDNDAYRFFLKYLITFLSSFNQGSSLAAIDETLRGEWPLSENHALASLLDLPFENGTEIAKLLDATKEFLLITDHEGLEEIYDLLQYMPKWHVILYQEGDPAKLVVNKL